VLAPFTRAVVPVVDIAAGRVVIDPPDGLLDAPRQRAAERVGESA
jgi:16S rRNA processing protein RimM